MKPVGLKTVFSRTVEDFFRGIGMLLGGTIAVAVLFFAAAFLLFGFYAAYKMGDLIYISGGVFFASIILGVPTLLVFIGKKIRRDQ